MNSKNHSHTAESPKFDGMALKWTRWIGSTSSLIIHTLFFIGSFMLAILGVGWDRILLVLTTVVSLEAIYLAIFIQMSVNRNTQSLEAVEKDIDEIQEDVDEIQEDVVEIQEDDKEEDIKDQEAETALKKIHEGLQQLMIDVDKIKSNHH